MVKPDLGTKRVCPTTGRKFYDLNKDPIVSPYTGEAFPRSLFEPQMKTRTAEKPAPEAEAETSELQEDVELISLEDADEDTSGKKRADPSIDGDDDELEDDISTDDDDDTFLADDEDDGDDVSDLIEGDLKDDEEP
ncbi:TIGR02300 family protein [Agaricicola taiwanensis]|uniref:TIGR02300 family protein n=1 Tax=Agaricicola taiwanensis TaxID=591372 RepID=UPI00166906EF|nr:TIGR02300 family protein [Agaricicola taiwanensis]